MTEKEKVVYVVIKTTNPIVVNWLKERFSTAENCEIQVLD